MIGKVLTRVVAVLILLIGVGFFLFSLNNFYSRYKAEEKATGASTFGDVVSNEPDPGFVDPSVKESEIYLDNLGRGLVDVNPSDHWNFSSSVFVSEVVSINESAGQITLTITEPQTMPFLGKTLTADLHCYPLGSFLKVDGVTTDQVENLVTQIKPKDTFMALCLDDACSSVGGFCKLIRGE